MLEILKLLHEIFNALKVRDGDGYRAAIGNGTDRSTVSRWIAQGHTEQVAAEAPCDVSADTDTSRAVWTRW